MDIGDIIRQKRKALRLTQVELSQRSGIDQGHISRIESGESVNVTLGNLRAIAKALGCSVTDLLPEQDKKTKAGKANQQSVA